MLPFTISGMPKVVQYGQRLARNHDEALDQAGRAMSATLQRMARERARTAGEKWAELADSIVVRPGEDPGTYVIEVAGQSASMSLDLEYGREIQAPNSVLRSTVIEGHTEASKAVQAVLDKFTGVTNAPLR